MAERKPTRKAPQKRKAAIAAVPEDSTRSFSDEEIALKAYELWEARGCPLGSPEEDWHNAKTQLSGPE